jgi:hypothetical protein
MTYTDRLPTQLPLVPLPIVLSILGMYLYNNRLLTLFINIAVSKPENHELQFQI